MEPGELRSVRHHCRIHPEKQYEGKSVLQLTGYDPQGQPAELLLAFETDALFEWLAAVRRAIGRYQETGGAVPDDDGAAGPGQIELGAVGGPPSFAAAAEAAASDPPRDTQLEEALRQSLAGGQLPPAAGPQAQPAAAWGAPPMEGQPAAYSEDAALEQAMRESLAAASGARRTPYSWPFVVHLAPELFQ